MHVATKVGCLSFDAIQQIGRRPTVHQFRMKAAWVFSRKWAEGC